MKGDEGGWFDNVPRTHWRCPECNETSPVEEWAESYIACDTCGDHEARKCPRCGELFDTVWGQKELIKANPSPSDALTT